MGDEIGWLVVGAFWLLINFLSSLNERRKAKQQPPAPPPPQPAAPQPAAPQPAAARRPAPPPPPPAATDPLTELLKNFGIDVNEGAGEQPVASEHRRTRGEHAPTLSETRSTASEHRHTPGWHERTASETRRTASEHRRVASEHRGTLSEHVAGDVTVPGVRRLAPAASVQRQGRSAFARSLVSGLKGNRKSLAKAIVLREILGPPVGMRSPGE